MLFDNIYQPVIELVENFEYLSLLILLLLLLMFLLLLLVVVLEIEVAQLPVL